MDIEKTNQLIEELVIKGRCRQEALSIVITKEDLKLSNKFLTIHKYRGKQIRNLILHLTHDEIYRFFESNLWIAIVPQLTTNYNLLIATPA
jgi:hypothetical protein